MGASAVTDDQKKRYQKALGKIDFKGHVSQDEMCRIMQSHQIYLFPSLSEGFAKSALEAMSMGLCVLCTFETGLPMTDGQDGYLIRKNDAGSIVSQVQWLVRNPERMCQVGLAATEVMTKYTWEAYAANVKKIYDELMEI